MIHKLTIYGLYFIGFFLFFGIFMRILDDFELLGEHIYSTGAIVNITTTNDPAAFLCFGEPRLNCEDRTYFTFEVEFYDELGFKHITSERIFKRRQLDYDINLLTHKKGDIINLRYVGSPPRSIKLLTDFY